MSEGICATYGPVGKKDAGRDMKSSAGPVTGCEVGIFLPVMRLLLAAMAGGSRQEGTGRLTRTYKKRELALKKLTIPRLYSSLPGPAGIKSTGLLP
jgi:hypothetical protein